MNYLAIDTSSSQLLVTLNFNGKQYSSYNENCNMQHSVLLNSEIENLLNSANATLSDMDFFACNVGAGSFTGIRIGISTIKAFSFALKKKVLPITSFEVLAYNTDRIKTLAIIDAKNDNYYVAPFLDGVMGKPEFLHKDNILQKYFGYEMVSYEHIDGLNCKKVDLLNGFIKAIEDNLDKTSSDREILVPLYVRKSQAEENL